jgi:hypothetical protein
MRLKLLGIGFILISLLLLRWIIYKLDNNFTNISKCPEEVLAKIHEINPELIPSKIVIKPWKGRHNVHGIFILPAEDQSPKLLVLRIAGAGTFCGGAHNIGTSFEGIQAKPGYYLLRTNLRTRTSIWLIARGFANQLNDSHNWRLINY